MDSEDPEVRKDAYVNAIVYDALNATDHLISYFSCWRRLKVAVAWFLRLKGHLFSLPLDHRLVKWEENRLLLNSRAVS